jgi:hypothetical protein
VDSTTPEDAPVERARPIPDLGFFAGPPQSGTGTFASQPSSTFGGAPPSQFGGPPPSQFGGAPPSQFGGPPPSQFGGPPPSQWGAPTQAPGYLDAAYPGAGKRSVSPQVKAVAGAVALVLVIGLAFAGRFAWHQFGASPVVPATLMGMPRLTGASVETGMREAQQNLGNGMTKGSEAKVAMYSDGQGVALMVMALRGGSDPSSTSGDDSMAGWSRSTQGKAECYSQGPQKVGEPGVTMCMRGFWRRAVLVIGFSDVSPSPEFVARATEEAWKAQ